MSGRFLYSTEGRRGGAIRQFLATLIGAWLLLWLLVYLASEFLVNPLAARLGHAEMSMQSTGLALLVGSVALGLAWHAVRSLFLLTEALLSNRQQRSGLYEILTPDGFSLFFVSRLPAFYCGLVVLTGLAALAVWAVFQLLALMF